MLVDEIIHSAINNSEDNFELLHHGVKGMKWGVRRAYNKKETSGAKLLNQKETTKMSLNTSKGLAKQSKEFRKHSESVLSKKDTSIRRGYNKVATKADNIAQANKRKIAKDYKKVSGEYSKKVKEAAALNPEIILRKRRSQAKKILYDVLNTNSNSPINSRMYTDRDQFRYDVKKQQ